MGYGINRFIGAIDQNLICSICSCVLEDAVLTPCGHSFCQLCLETWLARPASCTCPECRGTVTSSQIHPILSIRNLINNMNIVCDFNSHGCKVVVKLDELKTHLDECKFVPVECAGCRVIVNRNELAEHHIRCDAIAAVVRDEDDYLGHRFSLFTLNSTAPHVAELACRVATLEIQLKRMKKDLEAADVKNKKLDRELRKTKQELEAKRNQLLDLQYVDFDPDYEYGFAPHTIIKLACLISRFLLNKPAYIDKNRIYHSIKRSHDNYGHAHSQHDHDVHMLLATAFASNWFSENQRLNFHCWLQRLSRSRSKQFGLNMSLTSTNTFEHSTSRTASM